MYEICIQNLKVVCKTKPAANLSQALFKWLLSVLPKTSCKPLVCKPYKAKLCMAFWIPSFCDPKLCFGTPVLPKTSCKPLVCKPYKAKLCMAAKLLTEGGKTPHRRWQNFVQTFGLQALQSKALYGGKTSCKTSRHAKLRKAFASHTKLTKRSFVQAL